MRHEPTASGYTSDPQHSHTKPSLRETRNLLQDLDSLGNAMPDNPHFAKIDEAQDKAYDLMFGDARKLFDLSVEKEELRERYGMNTFGQSCLNRLPWHALSLPALLRHVST